MAKQTQKQAVDNTAAVSATEVLISTQVVSIVPVKQEGQIPVLFTPQNTEQLIQAFVNSEVVNFDFTAETCAELVKTHSKKKVKDKEDIKGYEAVKTAYNELVKIRTSTDKKRTELGKPYSNIKAGIDKYAKDSVIGVLAAEEARLKVEKDKFEKWEQEEKDRKEKEAGELAKKRVTELKEAGLTFDGEFYVISEISVDIVTIKKMSEIDYAFFLAKVKDAKKKIDDEAAAAQAAKEAEEKKAAADKVENERKAKELRDEKLELRREKLTDSGFTDEVAKERFYIAGEGYFYELTYNEAAEYSAADFKSYLESAMAHIAEVKRAADEAAQASAAKPAETPTESEPAQPSTDPAKEQLIQADVYNLRVFYVAFRSVQAPELKTEEAKKLFSIFKNEVSRAVDALENDLKVYGNE
jgi:hypothetical protein